MLRHEPHAFLPANRIGNCLSIQYASQMVHPFCRLSYGYQSADRQNRFNNNTNIGYVPTCSLMSFSESNTVAFE